MSSSLGERYEDKLQSTFPASETVYHSNGCHERFRCPDAEWSWALVPTVRTHFHHNVFRSDWTETHH